MNEQFNLKSEQKTQQKEKRRDEWNNRLVRVPKDMAAAATNRPNNHAHQADAIVAVEKESLRSQAANLVCSRQIRIVRPT
jgi:hypothetical protein